VVTSDSRSHSRVNRANFRQSSGRRYAQTLAALAFMAECEETPYPAKNQHMVRRRASKVRFAGLRPPLTPLRRTSEILSYPLKFQ
jgi:hypothetical protein